MWKQLPGTLKYRLLHLSVDTGQKKHVLMGCQAWHVLPPNIWSLTAVKANCRAKGKLFICFWLVHFPHTSFLSTVRFMYISCSETARLTPEIILNIKKFLQRMFCWAKTNQVDNSYSNLWMFGGKTFHVVMQIVKARKLKI